MTTLSRTFKTGALAIAGTVATFTFASSAHAASIVVQTIDPFDVDQNVANVGASIGPNGVVINSTLLGNNVTRTISGNITLGSTAGGSVTVDVNQSQASAFAVSNGPGRRSNISTVYTNLTTPVDFTVSGVADRIMLSIVENDTPMTIRFNFTDADGTTGFLTTTSPGTAGTPAIQSILYSSATSSGGTTPGLNFANITAFSFETNANLNNSSDIIMDFVSVGREMPASTPEPATILGLLAFAGLGGSTLKKKEK